MVMTSAQTEHPVQQVSEEQAAAEEAVRVAFARYLTWQHDGDWDTFLSFVDDEGGVRARKEQPKER
jgi:hypothetical protein